MPRPPPSSLHAPSTVRPLAPDAIEWSSSDDLEDDGGGDEDGSSDSLVNLSEVGFAASAVAIDIEVPPFSLEVLPSSLLLEVPPSSLLLEVPPSSLLLEVPPSSLLLEVPPSSLSTTWIDVVAVNDLAASLDAADPMSFGIEHKHLHQARLLSQSLLSHFGSDSREIVMSQRFIGPIFDSVLRLHTLLFTSDDAEQAFGRLHSAEGASKVILINGMILSCLVFHYCHA